MAMDAGAAGLQPLDVVVVQLVGVHLGLVAQRHGVLHDVAHRHARLHVAGREVEYLQIAPIAHDHVVLGVDHAQALGHVVERGVEAPMLLAHLNHRGGALGLDPAPLGDVLVGADPAAVGHRADRHFDGAPVGQRLLVNDRPPLCQQRKPARHQLVHRLGVDTAPHAVGENLPQGHARPDQVAVGVENLDVLLVADDQALVRVEHAQALRHVVEGGVEQQVLLAQRVLVAQAHGDVLVGGHPAAVADRPQRRLDHAPVAQHDPLLERGAPPDAVHALGVQFVDGHVAVTAAGDRVDEEVAVGNAGLHHGRIEAVGAHVFFIAHDQPLVRTEQAEPVRHVADRPVEALDLDAQRGIEALLLGHVLIDRNPAAFRQRLVAHGHVSPARQLAAHAERLAAPQQVAALVPERLHRCGLQVPALGAVRQHVPVRQARPDHTLRQIEDLEVAPVEHGDAPFGVEHAQAVRHGVERGLVQREQRAQPVRPPVFRRPLGVPSHGLTASSPPFLQRGMRKIT
jgi:hypothetical protein